MPRTAPGGRGTTGRVTRSGGDGGQGIGGGPVIVGPLPYTPPPAHTAVPLPALTPPAPTVPASPAVALPTVMGPPTGHEPESVETRSLNEFSTLLSSLGFSNTLCNWMTRKEGLLLVEDLLMISKDAITTIFSRIAEAKIHYTGSQDSIFRALHHYTRRMNSHNIPIDPTVIDRNTLIQEMVEMDVVQNMRSTGVKTKEEA